jgi:peptide/nickel transport system permease protein
MQLALVTLVLAVLFSVPLGVISAVKQNTWADYLVRVISISGLSMPLFLTGILMLYLLIAVFSWLPPLEYARFTDDPLTNLSQIVWPAIAQALYISAPIMRLTRSQMLDVIREDYVRTARSKGLPETQVVYGHALRNALLPVVTFIGWWGGRLLGGIVIMEIIFGIPGMGTSLIAAVNQRDYPTVQAIVFLLAMVFLGTRPRTPQVGGGRGRVPAHAAARRHRRGRRGVPRPRGRVRALDRALWRQSHRVRGVPHS